MIPIDCPVLFACKTTNNQKETKKSGVLPPNLVLKSWIRKDTLMQVYYAINMMFYTVLRFVSTGAIINLSTVVVSKKAIKFNAF